MNIKINGVEISSPFGATEPFRGGVPHTGIDIPMSTGTPLHTIKDGVVDRLLGGKCGEGVAIKTGDGKEHIFCHMDEVNVAPGQEVNAGDIIGLSGNTGQSTGPHLHFAVKEPNGTFSDPSQYAEAFAGNGGGSTLLDKYNQFSDWFVGKEIEIFWKPFQAFLHDSLLYMWNWIIANLPDIMGYSAVLAGICIILSAMAGKGILKPLAAYGGSLIIALCILMGA